MAEDVDVLERHLASYYTLDASQARPYVRLSVGTNESIVYRRVSKRRMGLRMPSAPGSVQLEIIENVLGRHKKDVLEL